MGGVPHFGWAGAYGFSALAALTAALVAARLPAHQRAKGAAASGPDRPEDPGDGPERPSAKAAAELTSTWGFVKPPLIRVVIGSGTSAFAFMALFAFYQPYALEAGVERVGDYFLGFTATALGMRFFMGGLPDRIGTQRVAFFATLGYVFAPLALPILGPGLLFAVGAYHGLFHGVHFPVMSALAVERVEPATRGRALTLLVGAFNGGAALGGWVLGHVAQHYGYDAAFAGGALVAAFGLIALGWPRRHPRAAAAG